MFRRPVSLSTRGRQYAGYTGRVKVLKSRPWERASAGTPKVALEYWETHGIGNDGALRRPPLFGLPTILLKEEDNRKPTPFSGSRTIIRLIHHHFPIGVPGYCLTALNVRPAVIGPFAHIVGLVMLVAATDV